MDDLCSATLEPWLKAQKGPDCCNWQGEGVLVQEAEVCLTQRQVGRNELHLALQDGHFRKFCQERSDIYSRSKNGRVKSISSIYFVAEMHGPPPSIASESISLGKALLHGSRCNLQPPWCSAPITSFLLSLPAGLLQLHHIHYNFPQNFCFRLQTFSARAEHLTKARVYPRF